MQLICGVDEAGRGPVIGSLVIAGALFYEDQINSLIEMGVKDSKLLSPVKRRTLFKEIEKLSLKYVVTKIKPFEIDQAVFKKGLNILEAKIMAEIIKELSPNIAYVDAPDVNERRFGNNIKERISVPTNIVSEHHADSKYVVVGALL